MNWNDLIYKLDLRPSQVKELQYYLENFPITDDLFTDEFIDELTWEDEDRYASYIGQASLIKYLEKELNEPIKGFLSVYIWCDGKCDIEIDGCEEQTDKIKTLINELGIGNISE